MAGDAEPYQIRDSYYLRPLWQLTAIAKPVEDGPGVDTATSNSRPISLGTVRWLV
jgi:hypothetical protein